MVVGCASNWWAAFLLMYSLWQAGLISTSCAVAGNLESPEKIHKNSLPHILFVLVDDLGWGDVGFHRQPKPREVQTPVMDRLAQEEGLELNRHYVHKSCTGTRTSLQSGRFPVHVQTSLKNPEDPSSGMPRNLTGLAEHLKTKGYATHYVGKWDVGMATPKHTPKGRGYDTSLNYFEHKNDFWTQDCMQSVCCSHHIQEKLASQQKKGHTGSITNTKIKDLWDTDRPARSLAGTDYEEFIFQKRMLDIIDRHAANATKSSSKSNDNQQQPLFLFYAPHVAHCPLQVPQSYLDQFAFMDVEGTDEATCKAQTAYIVDPDSSSTPPPYSCRKQYHAMVKLMDDIIGSLVDRLKQHGMWENTVMVLTSDNGGPVGPDESAATNFPLRGGKYSDWEGGVRATAFVSGGFIPVHRRGQVVQHPIHIADWYATLPALAGLDIRQGHSKTEDSRVPPVDAVNVWPAIMGVGDKTTEEQDEIVPSPRVEIPLSEHALIVGDYKLLWNNHDTISYAGWTYPDYPNKQTAEREIRDQTIDCVDGCLFNVAIDPGEHNNIASEEPSRVRAMKKSLEILRQGFFENDDRGVDSCPYAETKSIPCACWMAVNHYGGFFGPYQEVDIFAREVVDGYEAVL